MNFESLFFIGTSNTFTARAVIDEHFPNCRRFAIGDCSSALASYILECVGNDDFVTYIVLDTAVNDVCMTLDGTISRESMTQSLVLATEILKEKYINLKGFLLLDLVPSGVTDRGAAHSDLLRLRRDVLSSNLSVPFEHIDFRVNDSNPDLECADPFHFTIGSYRKIFENVRSLISTHTHFEEEVASLEVLSKTERRASSFSATQVAARSGIQFLDTYIRGEFKLPVVSLSDTTKLLIRHRTSGKIGGCDCIRLSHIMFVSTTHSGWLVLANGTDIYCIQTKVRDQPGIIRLVDLYDAKIVLDRNSQTNSHVEISFCECPPENARLICHNNSEMGAEKNRPESEKVDIQLVSVGSSSLCELDEVEFDISDEDHSLNEEYVVARDTAMEGHISVFYDSFWPGFSPFNNPVFAYFSELLGGARVADSVENADVTVLSVFCENYDLKKGFREDQKQNKRTNPVIYRRTFELWSAGYRAAMGRTI